MRELAEFEKYASDFAITEEVLHEQGFRRSPPDFHCLIAESDGELVGFLVYYLVPFTYRAKPNLIIKELYVADGCRSKGVGKLLMKAVAKQAEQAGCGMIKWYVAKWNERGIEFYERLGAKIDSDGTNSSCRKKRFAIWHHPGSARVSRVWRWRPAIANFSRAIYSVAYAGSESPFWRDAKSPSRTGDCTRDACATQATRASAS